MKAVLDIETDGLDATRIHLVVCKDLDTGWLHHFREWDKDKLQSFLDGTECLIMHNGISFDLPVLEKLWNIKYPYCQILDTLIVAQLNNPIREGGNSLANWGEILKFPKMTQPESFKEYTADMHKYCIRDVEVTEKLYFHLKEAMRGWSKHSVKLEHSVRRLLDTQKKNGFFIDQEKVLGLLAVLDDEAGVLNEKLVDTFEPTIEVMKTKTKIHPFNPQSRQQIGDRLIKRGWKPKQFTEKTGKPVVNEGTLKECTIPEAEDIRRYMLLRKRSAQASSWVKATNQDTGRVHGNVITIGAVTNRMSHNSPNMAQIPNGDIHSANQRMAGLDTRDQAKTFIYAFLYGAGPSKIGSVVGKDAKAGQKLIDKFLSSMPKLSRFRERTIQEAEATKMVKGLDGRYFHIKSSHSAVNTLLQGAGAIICKEWLCHITHKVKIKGLDANPVANIHDEVQFEVHKDDAEEFCDITKTSMKDTEKSLDVRCPLDSEAKIGLNWAETH